MACIEAAKVIPDEGEIQHEAPEILRHDSDLIEEVKQSDSAHSSRKPSYDNIVKRHSPITEAVLLKGTSLKKDKKDSTEKFLSKINQLHLNEKGITHIVKIYSQGFKCILG